MVDAFPPCILCAQNVLGVIILLDPPPEIRYANFSFLALCILLHSSVFETRVQLPSLLFYPNFLINHITVFAHIHHQRICPEDKMDPVINQGQWHPLLYRGTMFQLSGGIYPSPSLSAVKKMKLD